MSDIALLHATFASPEEAERVAGMMVDERLAACANVMMPCTSLYRWQGEFQRSVEVPVLFKTTLELASALHDRIAALHSYDLPVIETWPVAVADAVHGWVTAETGA